MKVLLFDIEGTTTDILFVHQVLFPYSYNKIKDYIINNQTLPEVQVALKEAYHTIAKEQGVRLGLYDLIDYLKFWISTDRKIACLKTIQGLIWDEGYKSGQFKGHVYPEVKDKFAEWKKKGFTLAIYSSGSVHAQKNIFKHSSSGDLTKNLSNYYDTQVGGKKESKSYEKISLDLGVVPAEITFFSDIPEELKAAQAAGLNVVHVVRPGTKKDPSYPFIFNFNEFTV